LTTRALFSAAPAIIAAFAAGELTIEAREVALADVEHQWSARVASGERLVFVP
jgi:hypothetical protein